MKGAGIRVIFGALRNLAVPTFLGTSFVNRFVRENISNGNRDCTLQLQTDTDNRHSDQDGRQLNGDEQEGDIFDSATVPEEAHNPPTAYTRGKKKNDLG